MPEILFKYYGLDWVAMFGSLLFVYLIGNKKKIGFFFGIIAGIAWIIVNFLADITAGVILNIIMIFLNVRAYIKWNQGEGSVSAEDSKEV